MKNGLFEVIIRFLLIVLIRHHDPRNVFHHLFVRKKKQFSKKKVDVDS